MALRTGRWTALAFDVVALVVVATLAVASLGCTAEPDGAQGAVGSATVDPVPAAPSRSAGDSGAEGPASSSEAEREERQKAPVNEQSEASEMLFPAELLAIPASYSDPCDQAGRVERFAYDTFEAFSYEDQAQPLAKNAMVYVPYGYDASKRYNIVYLMHGGWSDQTTYLGTPEAPSQFKNQLDHAMAEGIIEPCLIVCPTYNNTSDEDSGDYALALELTARYPNELVNDLMPAVESTYSTYADAVTPEGLAASRDHRAFMGFSMGSVTTWHIFENCLACFRYFAPSSGNAGSGAYWASTVERQGFGAEDFLIMGATGTEDFNGSAFSALMSDMADNPMFQAGDGEPGTNLIFRVGEGERHDGCAANRYIYNALAFLWH